MNDLQSSSIANLFRQVIESCEDEKKEGQKREKLMNLISSLVLRITQSKEEFKPNDFKFLPLNIKLILFTKLLKEHSSLQGLAQIIDCQTRQKILSDNQPDIKYILLKLIFKKENLNKLIVDTIGLSQFDIEKGIEFLTEEERKEIKHLAINHSLSLCNLEFLKFFPHLEILECKSNSKLRVLSGVHYCQKLEILNVSDCSELISLENIKNCSLLTELILKNCKKINHYQLSVLSSLSNLKHLDLSGCLAIKEYDLVPWNSLTHLHALNLEGNIYRPSSWCLSVLKDLKVNFN